MAVRRTGALRRKRSWLSQNWSKPYFSAACARARYSGRVRALLRRRLKRIPRTDNGFGFDFDEVVGSDEARFNQCVGRTDAAKALAVDTGDDFPVRNVADKDARTDDIV